MNRLNTFEAIGKLLFTVALAAAAALGVAVGDTQVYAEEYAWNDMPVPYDNPEAVEQGRSRFAERCTFCHGGGGRGAKGPCMICGKFKRGGLNSQIYTNIAAGVLGTQMGAFGTTLQQEEILNIVAYMRSQQLKKEAEEKTAEDK